MVIGIDPGLGGAVAWIGKTVFVLPMPVIGTSTKRGHRTIDGAELGRVFDSLKREDPCPAVYVEKAHAMPKQGIASAFNYGVGYGIVLGVIASKAMPGYLVTPQRWKARMLADLDRSNKDASIIVARQRFPSMTFMRSPKSRVPDHGMAEAMLIAEYGRLEQNGG